VDLRTDLVLLLFWHWNWEYLS